MDRRRRESEIRGEPVRVRGWIKGEGKVRSVESPAGGQDKREGSERDETETAGTKAPEKAAGAVRGRGAGERGGKDHPGIGKP